MKVSSTVQFARGAADDDERWTIFVPETSKHFTIGRVEASVIARFAPDRHELGGLEPAAVAPEAVDAFVARLKELRVLVDRDPAPARRVRLLGFPEWNPHALFSPLQRVPPVVAIAGMVLAVVAAAASFVTALPTIVERMKPISAILHSSSALAAATAMLGTHVVVHELAHAYVAEAWGCPVYRIGVSFSGFLPRPFCDVAPARLLPQRCKRVSVALGGPAGSILAAGVLTRIATSGAGSTITRPAAFVAVTAMLHALLNLVPGLVGDGRWALHLYRAGGAPFGSVTRTPETGSLGAASSADMPRRDHVLVVRGLTRHYGDVTAVDHLDLSCKGGEITGFLGRNGAGKSTALRCIMGLSAIDEGSVLWNGRQVDRAAQLRFGYMPEQRGLYPAMTVGDEITFFAEMSGLGHTAARTAALRWMERLQLDARADSRVDELSLGNQQRVQLAAALAHEPDLLILDEPFSGLDPAGVDLMSGLLRERARLGCAVLFSSHQLELVESICDRVVIIEAGRTVAQGTIAELSARQRPRVLIELDQARSAKAASATLCQHGHTEVLWAKGRTVLVEVDPTVHLQQLLRDLVDNYGVIRFEPVAPSLSEIFREIVA